ncbi:MAG: hypothetical protein Q9167_007005 [Letrouitia subvulpina]
MHVCNALMIFAELENQESLAQRVLLYPKEWDEAGSGQQVLGPRIATSKRLLRDAAKQYKVMLQPVEPMVKLKSESVFPLGGLLSLTSFNRLLFLPPSGLVLDTSGLDHLFTLPMEASMLGIATGTRDEKVLPSIVLLQPSNEAFHSILASIPSGSYNETSFLEKIPLVSDMPEDQIHVVARTSDLRLEDRDFNSSKFLEETSYVQFSDSGIIGPEYDISRTKLGLAQPKELQPLRAWREAYRRYMDRRMDVCGLDLESMPTDLRAGKQEG